MTHTSRHTRLARKPNLSIWVGSMSRKNRMFETTSKYADRWVISSLYLPRADSYSVDEAMGVDE